MAVLTDTTQLIGFADLGRKLDALRTAFGPRKVDRLTQKALTISFTPVLNAAIALAPKDTGQLSERIYMRIKKPTGIDKASKYYQGESVFARVTSSPIRQESIKVFKLRKSGGVYKERYSHYKNVRPVGVSQEFGNKTSPQYRGQGFMRVALAQNSQRVLETFEKELLKLIDKLEFLKV